jgi:hypothetical protein
MGKNKASANKGCVMHSIFDVFGGGDCRNS